jgi:hypothetical protein
VRGQLVEPLFKLADRIWIDGGFGK